MSYMKIAVLFLSLILGQNSVCYDINENYDIHQPGLGSFTSHIQVLDCVDIYAESLISDSKILHVAAVVSELLDNNEDGIVDDPLIMESLQNLNAMIPIFNSEWASSQDDVYDNYSGCLGAALYRNEINPNHPGHWGIDATVEEVLHTINNCGHVNVYPNIFSLMPNSSMMSDAMDIARGGQFLEIPANYPEDAWYHYNDNTCDYECMAIEYLYWCLVSYMGVLNDTETCYGISDEWELCSPELFENHDVLMHSIIDNPIYKLPKLAPDGNYCPESSIQGDVNQDGLVNILDIVVTVNMIFQIVQFDLIADLNQDSQINILDVILIVNIILS